MAKRILWDKYETVLLIDLYFQIERGEVSRQDGVSKLSNILRQMAVEQGLEIDEIYRNENGISLRLYELQYLFTDGEFGVERTSKLFKEYVNLYLYDKASFNSVLEEAKRRLLSK